MRDEFGEVRMEEYVMSLASSVKDYRFYPEILHFPCFYVSVFLDLMYLELNS